jgi:glycosyltransferase 2 family protein
VHKGRLPTRALRILFLVLTGVGIAIALYRLWPDVTASLSAVSWGALCLSTLLALGFQLIGMLAWRTALRELGSPVRPASAAHIYLVSQLGKYVPGSLWAGLAMLKLGQDAAIPRARMAYSYALSLAFSLMTGLAIGVPALIAYGGDYLPLAVTVLAVLAVVLLWPRLLNGILDRGLRLARRGRLEQPLRGAGIARIVTLYLLAWTLGGLHVWVLAAGLGADPLQAIFPGIAAFTVASTLGVIVVLAPAGAGVRDVLMAVILAPVAGAAAATAITVVSRGVLTLLDLAGAAVAWLAWRSVQRRSTHPELHPTGQDQA